MSTWRILVGDVRETLAQLPAGSVQTCVTSPPYWGLRDYGTATWDGGDPVCDHMQSPRASGSTTLSQWRTELDKDAAAARYAARSGDGVPFRAECLKCGARRIDSQLGLEPTPSGYVANLSAVFAEVWRVLRDDGTLFLNLGDAYSSKHWNGRGGKFKPKDLVGIPWMVAFALRADGWYLRSDIIWAKPNPMPESVTDRPTKSHEYLFLLSKRPTYYYDAAAIAESLSEITVRIHSSPNVQARGSGGPWKQDSVGNGRGGLINGDLRDGTRNKRTVWTVATQPYPEAHFATYPEDLITPCILAGSKPGDLVLDPFTGSGTTGAVAIRHQRSFVGCELNPSYVELARKRIGSVAPMFAEEVA